MATDTTTYCDTEEYGDHILSKAVKAGRRTYFFDVKSTRNNDYFLTITESRKKIYKDGHTGFERQKIFLYKEDFAKFSCGLSDVIEFVKRNKPEFFERATRRKKFVAQESIDEEFDKL